MWRPWCTSRLERHDVAFEKFPRRQPSTVVKACMGAQLDQRRGELQRRLRCDDRARGCERVGLERLCLRLGAADLADHADPPEHELEVAPDVVQAARREQSTKARRAWEALGRTLLEPEQRNTVARRCLALDAQLPREKGAAVAEAVDQAWTSPYRTR